MLRQRYRLKSRLDFKKALAGRRLCANDCFVIYTLSVPKAASASVPARAPRFGFIISKKVHKRAVVRNRIKRRLRELVRARLLAPTLHSTLAEVKALVFIARPGSVEATYQMLSERLERCFKPAAPPL